MEYSIIFSLFLIFSGAAVLATLALYTRQSLLVAYIVLGALLGPWGTGLITDAKVISEISQCGIIFLLFLLGLNLQPQSLFKMLRQTTVVTLLSALIFSVIGYAVAKLWGFSQLESIIIGSCMMYSSTIIGLKLLPTTVMHNQKMGEIIISVLLLQDIVAVFTLLIFHGANTESGLSLTSLLSVKQFVSVMLALPGLLILAFVLEKWVLIPLFNRFNRIHEYLFLVAIGWCLGFGQLAEYLNLSFEIGAFIAGIAIAVSPISRFIAESLKPLRDFFLVLFFFALGAGMDVTLLPDIIVPAAILAGLMLIIKPLVFGGLLMNMMGGKSKSLEVGVRLGQVSEFSLLVAYVASESHLITEKASYLIEAATLLTFIISSYWIVNRYPSPMGATDQLRRD